MRGREAAGAIEHHLIVKSTDRTASGGQKERGKEGVQHAGDARYDHRSAEGERMLQVLQVGFTEALRMFNEQAFQIHVSLQAHRANESSAASVTPRWTLGNKSGESYLSVTTPKPICQRRSS
jgi:hypothetical protein